MSILFVFMYKFGFTNCTQISEISGDTGMSIIFNFEGSVGLSSLSLNSFGSSFKTNIRLRS